MAISYNRLGSNGQLEIKCFSMQVSVALQNNMDILG